MSAHHHHHPHEGHGKGNPPGADDRPLRHNWFFYVAGFFLVVALICFILDHNLNIQSVQPPTGAPATPAALDK